MTRKSPRTSAGLSMFAASIAAPMAVPCPIRLCSSSMNRMTSLAAVVSATIAANALLVLTAICRPGEQRDVIERKQSNVAQRQRHVLGAMRWANPSAMAVLPTPAGPTSVGLFLPCRRRMSMTRATSCVPAAHRLEASGARVGRQVAREAAERAACGFVAKEISDHVDGEAGRGKREKRFGTRLAHRSCRLFPIPRPLPPLVTRA